jgi:hypothetical protein
MDQSKAIRFHGEISQAEPDSFDFSARPCLFRSASGHVNDGRIEDQFAQVNGMCVCIAADSPSRIAQDKSVLIDLPFVVLPEINVEAENIEVGKVIQDGIRSEILAMGEDEKHGGFCSYWYR